MSPLEARAKAAFDAYSAAVGGKTYDGKDIPQWEALTETVRGGWIAATTAAFHYEEPAGTVLPGLTEGRIVHYVLPNGTHRAAIVAHVWGVSASCPGYVNLQVFTDGGNDLPAFAPKPPYQLSSEDAESIKRGMYWAVSICYSEGKEPGTWHWIERA